METVVWGDGEQPGRHDRDGSVTKVGRYRVLRKIDTGGAGEVYLGSYDIMGREVQVAIKLLKSSHAYDDASNQRFREEVRMLMELAHPNICRVLDGGDEGGRLYMVMEFADGGSLKDRVKNLPNGRAEPSLALRWLEEAARGLLAAETNVDEHGKKAPVYHRDIKPANLLLQDGRVVVADFGAAKTGGETRGLTTTVAPASWTPEYGSPEQWRGRMVDQRSDIYSLGVTFYKLLTGELPQKRFTHADERFSESHDPRLVLPGVPKDLAAIIRKMTEPEVENRYQGFAEVLADLDQLSPDGSKPVPPALWRRLLPAFLVAGAAVAGVLVWRGAGSEGESGSMLVLKAERQRQDAVQNAARQLEADVAAQGELRPKLVSEVPELQQPAKALGERLASAQAVLDEAKNPPTAPDMQERLGSIRRDLIAARKEYDAARGLLQQFEQASAELATRKMPTLEQFRRPVPGDNDLLEQRRRRLEGEIDTLREQRADRVDAVRNRFGGGESDLAVLRQEMGLLRDELNQVEETKLVDSLSRLLRDVDVATDLQAKLAPWSTTGPLQLSDVGRLKELVAAVAASKLPEASTPQLQGWFRQRCDEHEKAWRRELQRAISDARANLVAQIAALGGDAAPPADLAQAVVDYAAIRDEVIDGRLMEYVQEAPALPQPRPTPVSEGTSNPKPQKQKAPLPEGWPDERFEPPPGFKSLALRRADIEAQRLYSREFLEQAEKRGCRLWYSPTRLDRNQRPVYQAFVVDGARSIAALIDIHPMTLGELRMYPGFRRPAYLYGAIRDLPDEAFYPSCSDAMSVVFAGFVNDRPDAAFGAEGYGKFDVAPAGWRKWSGCVRFSEPPAFRPVADARPELAMPLASDLATAGIAYWASGVKEWGRVLEGTAGLLQPQGESEIAEDTADPRKGIGARLALILQRR